MDDPHAVGRSRAQHPSGDGERRPLRVLVVDADPMTCPSIARATRGLPWTFIGRPDTPSAIDTLRSDAFDVVIIRLDEAPTDGIQLVRELAEHRHEQQVVGVAKYAYEARIARALGVRELLTPSWKESALRRAIRQCARSDPVSLPGSARTSRKAPSAASSSRARRLRDGDITAPTVIHSHRSVPLQAVLVVGNDPGPLTAIRAVVGTEATIFTRIQARRAFELLQQRRFDALVVILDPPSGTRLALLRNLRGALRPDRVVVLTDDAERIIDAHVLGLTAILTKHCSPNELREALFGPQDDRETR